MDLKLEKDLQLRFARRERRTMKKILSLAIILAMASAVMAEERKDGADGLGLQQLTTLAINGSAYYQAALSNVLRYGDLGAKSDYAGAAQWANESANAKNPLGLYALAALTDGGLGVQADKAKADELFKEAAPGLEAMAKEGDFRACYAFAYLRYAGRGGVAQDKAQAAALFIKAAEAGDIHAAYMAGVLYQRGEGVEQNTSKAVEWLLKAAQVNDRKAQCALGKMYLKTGVTPNSRSEASRWIVMAAEAGDAEAQYLAGYLFENGVAGQKDMNKALQYYHRSALQGDESAKKRLKSFANDMRKTLGIEKPQEPAAEGTATPAEGQKPEAAKNAEPEPKKD